MSIKTLRDLGVEIIVKLTLKHSKELLEDQEVWQVLFEIWSYISLLPLAASALFYKILNKYAHALSHDCKIIHNELGHFPTLTADDVFIMLITCQLPKLILNYRMKRQRIIPQNILPYIQLPLLSKYFETSLSELDLSGADFCCDDSLLIVLLPKCRSLQVLCLGNAGSNDVLLAAQTCPLKKLQLEERFPLHPKLPQDTVLKCLLGYAGSSDDLNTLLEICKIQTMLENTNLEEEFEDIKIKRIECLQNFLSRCKPWWPGMKTLIFGNCRMCREALCLCLLVLKSLEEISIHRIQSDEILNTCERVFNSFGLQFQISIRRLYLTAMWSGFRSKALEIAPNVDTLGIIAHGYSNLSLRETVERNGTLAKVTTLSMIGLKNAGPSVFNYTNPFLRGVQTLELSGVILTTEELLNIFMCLPNVIKLVLDYSELRNHNFVLSERKYPKNIPLTSFSIESSFVDKECLESLFLMARNIEHLCIRGKTRNFDLSFLHQEIFLYSSELKINYLELYPQFPLDIEGLVFLIKRQRRVPQRRFQLHIPLTGLKKDDFNILETNGWFIIPSCTRC